MDLGGWGNAITLGAWAQELGSQSVRYQSTDFLRTKWTYRHIIYTGFQPRDFSKMLLFKQALQLRIKSAFPAMCILPFDEHMLYRALFSLHVAITLLCLISFVGKEVALLFNVEELWREVPVITTPFSWSTALSFRLKSLWVSLGDEREPVFKSWSGRGCGRRKPYM